jgi:murein DD-endopeptidase MepM/ murein hydrolase activator NlpD
LAAALISSGSAADLNAQARPDPAEGKKEQARASAGQPRFGLPIACRLGEDCFIMHYVDADPSPAAQDFACGRQTYDRHDGTDFAIADEKAMAGGVAVLAAEAGQVQRTRDGMADRRIDGQAAKEPVAGTECGNGVVVGHGGGWETQYCHLRQGSVRVRPGDPVAKGDVLGMVGESGLAGFPHIHLSLRHLGKPVDPFVGLGAPPGCGGPRQPVWDAPLAYAPTGLVQAGFATRAPRLADAWAGSLLETAFPADSPALVFWAHDFGVLRGDVESIQIVAPGGEVVLDQEKTLQNALRDWLSFAGAKNRPEKPLAAGVWQAHYRLKREGQTLIDIRREAVLR